MGYRVERRLAESGLPVDIYETVKAVIYSS